jgi:hypothetical protein
LCWSCNPYCGGCKPPQPKPRKCPACNAFNFGDEDKCKRCGGALPARVPPVPVLCLYIGGAMCANPCGRHKKPPEDGAAKTCTFHTPLPDDRR